MKNNFAKYMTIIIQGLSVSLLILIYLNFYLQKVLWELAIISFIFIIIIFYFTDYILPKTITFKSQGDSLNYMIQNVYNFVAKIYGTNLKPDEKNVIKIKLKCWFHEINDGKSNDFKEIDGEMIIYVKNQNIKGFFKSKESNCKYIIQIKLEGKIDTDLKLIVGNFIAKIINKTSMEIKTQFDGDLEGEFSENSGEYYIDIRFDCKYPILIKERKMNSYPLITSKANASFYMFRFLSFIAVVLALSFLTPSSHLIIDPYSISENLPVNSNLTKTFYVKNLGVSLSDVILEPRMPSSLMQISYSKNGSSQIQIDSIKIDTMIFNNTKKDHINLSENIDNPGEFILNHNLFNPEEILLVYHTTLSDKNSDYIILIKSIKIRDSQLNISNNKNITISSKEDNIIAANNAVIDEDVGIIDIANLILIPESVPSNFSRDEVGLFKVMIDTKYLNPGEYRGFIDIKANKSTILGESKPISLGQIPVVLNVSEPKSSPPEQTSRRDINIIGNVNITKIESSRKDC